MIFVDESGKRWRRVKLATGLLGSTITIPVIILGAAALLYLPGWGGFSLTKPLSNKPQVKALQTSQPPAGLTGNNRPSFSTSSRPSNNSTGLQSDTSASMNPTNSAAAATLSSSTAPASSTTSTTTPAPVDTGLANQPIQPGNSDYGRSHQPTRF